MDALLVKERFHSKPGWDREEEDFAFSTASWGDFSDVGDEIFHLPEGHKEFVRTRSGNVAHRKTMNVRRLVPPARRESHEVANIDDSVARAKLARTLGMPRVPKKRWGAYKSLDGIFDKMMKYEKESDPAAIVRRIRRG